MTAICPLGVEQRQLRPGLLDQHGGLEYGQVAGLLIGGVLLPSEAPAPVASAT